MLTRERLVFRPVTIAQRNRRRQQRPPIDSDAIESMLYRGWVSHTSAHARDLANPRRYPAVAARWSLALEAARAMAPLEGAGA